MNPKAKRTLLLIGSDANLGYLLNRFAEQSEYQLTTAPDKISMQEVTVANPAAIIFLSMDFLDTARALVAELDSLEVPILVCSAVSDQVRARELGADSCLLHPITLEGFQNTLASVNVINHP
jgi:DNA-binding response OmpR family regulator